MVVTGEHNYILFASGGVVTWRTILYGFHIKSRYLKIQVRITMTTYMFHVDFLVNA